MKIEKVAENIIKVTIHSGEMKKWNVSYDNLSSANPDVNGMFWEIIRKATVETGMEFTNCRLVVEARMLDKDTVVMIITKKQTLCDEGKAKTSKNRCKSRYKYRTERVMLYSFNSLDEVIAFTKSNLYYCLLFDGKNSLYRWGEKLRLVVKIKGELLEYLEAFNDRISEYADISDCTAIFACRFEEHTKPIIEKNALKTVFYKM